MKDYSTFKAEDFAEDLSFRRYVLATDEEDISFWNEWILMNPSKKDEILKGKEILLSIINAFNQIGDEEIEQEIANLNVKIDEKENAKSIKKLPFQKIWWQVAAVLAFAFGLWFYNYNSQSKTTNYDGLTSLIEKDERIEKVNSGDKLMVVTLSDGSSIVLEKGSRISYPKHFSKGKREVILSGEAFFEIAKDPSMPFYVYTNNLVTKVLGTSFSIQEDKQTNNIKVIVKTGRVSVFARTEENLEKQQANSNLAGLVLTPNQQVVFNSEDLNLVRTLVETPNVVELPIKQEQFEFEKTPIHEVFATLERFYGLKIVYDAEVMKKCYLTASLNDEPLFEKLNLICKTIDARYEQIDAQIIIYSKGCL
ncbi:FecR family protein [Arcicella aurantiaca]|uniref:FecR family protein n=1 Tax=Arcicella aurantiaca TaxID=591202 RepID=A0A316DYP3_9BACT|nr:FecR family protein [Arcicella aurantiaca]PWK21643.1 FecR family protein [Arcicella aurantiaca]